METVAARAGDGGGEVAAEGDEASRVEPRPRAAAIYLSIKLHLGVGGAEGRRTAGVRNRRVVGDASTPRRVDASTPRSWPIPLAGAALRAPRGLLSPPAGQRSQPALRAATIPTPMLTAAFISRVLDNCATHDEHLHCQRCPKWRAPAARLGEGRGEAIQWQHAFLLPEQGNERAVVDIATFA